MTENTASELFLRVKQMDFETQDSLTRFYLRLLKEETWSYQLRKENLLPKEQSQEAYRKKLNKFVRIGFLSKGKRYYVDGKPRNPFKSNTDVIRAIVERYSFAKYETDAALASFKELTRNPSWQKGLDEKLHSKERMQFLHTLFPLIFMGKEIPRFFFKLLLSSASRTTPEVMRDSKYAHAYGLLSDILNNVQFDISYDGVDYVGKRFFLDVYVKDVMMLLYASGASEKHWDTMKIAILEDVTLPLFMPLKHQNSSDREYSRFANMTTSARFDEIIKYIDEVKDHFIKDYYGEGWQNELACYIAYAVTSSLDDPREDIQGLLRHLQTKYSVSRERVESVATDIQRKIDRNDLKGNSLLL